MCIEPSLYLSITFIIIGTIGAIPILLKHQRIMVISLNETNKTTIACFEQNLNTTFDRFTTNKIDGIHV
jgi:hypothetical protein